MSTCEDLLHSFLAQTNCTASKAKLSEKKRTYPIEKSNNKETVINQKGNLITQKRQDVAILQNKLNNHQNSSNKTSPQNVNTLKRPSTTSKNSQTTQNLNLRSSLTSNKNTAMKRPFSSSQQLINNNLSSSEKPKINHPLSDKQFSAKTLSKKSSIPCPTTKQLSSIQISQQGSKPSEIPRQYTINSQQSSQTIKPLFISERPLSTQATKILAAINYKLLNQSKSNSKFQNKNTSLEQSQPLEHFQSKQQQQQEQFRKKNDQKSVIFSQSQKSLTISNKNKQASHFIEGNNSLNKETLMKQAVQYQTTKIQQSQSPKYLKKNTNDAVFLGNNTKQLCKSQFFEILNEAIIEQIIRFLPLKDIAKFATLSRKTRKIVPGIISKIDYQNNIDQMIKKMKKQHQTFRIVFRFFKDQRKTLKMFKMHHAQIQQLIEKISLSSCPDNQLILDILKAGVLIHLNLSESNIDPVDYIKKFGILKVFQYLTYDHVNPIKQTILIPHLLSETVDNRLKDFIDRILFFLEYQQKCTLSVDTQRMCFKEIQLAQMRKLFMQQKKKALAKYSKPITRFRSSSNINNYLNKNILSVIITFLSLQELSHLSMSSKTMKTLVKESLLQLLPSAERQQSDDQEKAGISKKNAQTILYLMHFEWYYAKYDGIIMKKDLNRFLTKALLLAVGIMFPKEGKENNIYSKYGIEMYVLNHQIKLPKPNKICQVVDFLKEFPALKTFKNVTIEQSSNQDIIFGVYIYQYIRGLQMAYEQALDGGSLDIEIYNKVLFKNDCKIYCYKKLLGIEQDDLLVLDGPLSVSQQLIFKKRTGFTIFY